MTEAPKTPRDRAREEMRILQKLNIDVRVTRDEFAEGSSLVVAVEASDGIDDHIVCDNWGVVEALLRGMRLLATIIRPITAPEAAEPE